MKTLKMKLGILGIALALSSSFTTPQANAGLIVGGLIGGNPIVLGLGGALLLSQTFLFTDLADGGAVLLALDEKSSAAQIDQLAGKISSQYGADATDASAVAELIHNAAQSATNGATQDKALISIPAGDLARVTSAQFQATPGYGKLLQDLN
jgi:hypothetical protein